MKSFVRKYIFTIISIYTTSSIIPAFSVPSSSLDILYPSLILTVLLFIAIPIINIFMLPINFLTLSLSGWIINILIIYLWINMADNVSVSSWDFNGAQFANITVAPQALQSWQVFVLVSVMIIATSTFFEWLAK